MKRRVLVLKPDHHAEVVFDQQLTIGRDSYNTLTLADAEVSRSHAIIFEQFDRFYVKDLKSRNGVYINGQKVAEAELSPGDEIILGASVLLFEPDPATDIEKRLSERGRRLLERLAVRRERQHPPAPRTFDRPEMERALEDLLASPESSTRFSLSGAVEILQAIKEMDDALEPGELFECCVRRTLELVGGHRGVIMEVDEHKEHVKVRSIVSAHNTDTIKISQPILRILLEEERHVFCANLTHDSAYAHSPRDDQARTIRSFVASPIYQGDELFGFIYLDAEDYAIAYDFPALCLVYFMANHLSALLRPRSTHFTRHAPSGHVQSIAHD